MSNTKPLDPAPVPVTPQPVTPQPPPADPLIGGGVAPPKNPK